MGVQEVIALSLSKVHPETSSPLWCIFISFYLILIQILF